MAATKTHAIFVCDACTRRNHPFSITGRKTRNRNIPLQADGLLPEDCYRIDPVYGTRTRFIECPQCHDGMRELTRISGRVSKRGCSEKCWEATGGACNCECGGASHGIIEGN